MKEALADAKKMAGEGSTFGDPMSKSAIEKVLAEKIKAIKDKSGNF